MHKISSNFFPYKLGVHICKKSNLKKRRQINKITNGVMKVIFPHMLGVHICQKRNLKKTDKINKITNGIMKVFFFINIYIYFNQQVKIFIKDKRRTSG